MDTPYMIRFPKIGKTIEGYISVAEGDGLPFEVKDSTSRFHSKSAVNPKIPDFAKILSSRA